MVEKRFMESGSGGSSSEKDEQLDERLERKISGSSVAPSDDGGSSDTDVGDPTDAFQDLQGGGSSGGSDVGGENETTSSPSSGSTDSTERFRDASGGGTSGGSDVGGGSSSSGGGSTDTRDTTSNTGDTTPNTVTDAEQQDIDAAFSNTSEQVEDEMQGLEPSSPTDSTTRNDPTPGVITEAEQQDIDAAFGQVNNRVLQEQQGIEDTGAGSNAVAAAAMDFEQQVIRESSLADDPSDVRIVRDGDQLRAELTATGAEAARTNPSQQDIKQDVASRVDGVRPSDVQVRRRQDGSVSVSIGRDATGLEDQPDAPVGVQAAALGLERRVIENSPLADDPSDVRVVADGRGGLVAELTASGAEDARFNQSVADVRQEVAASNPGVDPDEVIVGRGEDGDLSIRLTAEGRRDLLAGRRRETSNLFDTTAQGTTGTTTSRIREGTARANQSRSLGTTGVQTTRTTVGDLDRAAQQRANRTLVEQRSGQLSSFQRRRQEFQREQAGDFELSFAGVGETIEEGVEVADQARRGLAGPLITADGVVTPDTSRRDADVPETDFTLEEVTEEGAQAYRSNVVEPVATGLGQSVDQVVRTRVEDGRVVTPEARSREQLGAAGATTAFTADTLGAITNIPATARGLDEVAFEPALFVAGAPQAGATPDSTAGERADQAIGRGAEVGERTFGTFFVVNQSRLDQVQRANVGGALATDVVRGTTQSGEEVGRQLGILSSQVTGAGIEDGRLTLGEAEPAEAPTRPESETAQALGSVEDGPLFETREGRGPAVAGLLTGGLLTAGATSAAISRASGSSSRAGQAVATAVQPGEEALRFARGRAGARVSALLEADGPRDLQGVDVERGRFEFEFQQRQQRQRAFAGLRGNERGQLQFSDQRETVTIGGDGDGGGGGTSVAGVSPVPGRTPGDSRGSLGGSGGNNGPRGRQFATVSEVGGSDFAGYGARAGEPRTQLQRTRELQDIDASEPQVRITETELPRSGQLARRIELAQAETTQQLLAEQEARQQQAQAPLTEQETALEGATATATDTALATGLDTRQALAQRSEVLARSALDSRFETLTETRTALDTRTGLESELAFETRLALESELATETQQEFALEAQQEQEQRQESETEPGDFRSRPETPESDSDSELNLTSLDGPLSSGSDETDGRLGFGFLSETLTDVAAGGFAQSTSPGQSTLLAFAAAGSTDLPTAELLEGGEDVEQTLDLFNSPLL